MNNIENVNATQNPNVTNTASTNVTNQAVSVVSPAVQPAVTNTNPVQAVTSGVTSPNVTQQAVQPAVTTNVTSGLNMPNIVNPLEIKASDIKEEIAPIKVKKEIDDEPKEKGPSEYALKLQKALDDYKPPSKFQMNFTIFMFIIIILFALFLPEISNYITFVLGGGNQPLPQDPVNGILNCKLETVTSNLDKTFTRKFTYEENKLKKVELETTTRGDITLDEETLDNLYNECEMIRNSVENVTASVSIKCNYKEGLLIEKEIFNLQSFDTKLIESSYAEAGRTVLEFDYDADIDVIMKSMRQAGFTCSKESNE